MIQDTGAVISTINDNTFWHTTLYIVSETVVIEHKEQVFLINHKKVFD